MSDRSAPATLEEAGPELNPALDRGALAAEFRERGRVHIPRVLTQASALRLYRALTEETAWKLTLNKGKDFLDFANVTPEERSRIALGAWERAQREFQYFFDNHRLSTGGEPYPDPNHYFARVVQFLNAPQTVAFVREVTDLDAIAWADAQATLYRPGDFLTQHNDQKNTPSGHKRVAAYVLNMTPGWRSDWGGVLQFLDSRGHVAEGYVPAFNALNLFRVPAVHAVSQVSIFGGFRYSITGWYHAK